MKSPRTAPSSARSRLARNLVTNAEWLAFMQDGGYGTATLWLMDGFAAVSNEDWQAPGHWRQVDGEWRIMTLGGLQPIDPSAPVSHVSYYEADAFARWAGKHLPTEMEWEVAARAGQLNDAFGIVWQWTRSSYSPYPGYRAIEGALGEYNGKFMVNQLVLRGSSLATPARPQPYYLSQLLLSPPPLAIHGVAPRRLRLTFPGMIRNADAGFPIRIMHKRRSKARRKARSGEYHECARLRFGQSSAGSTNKPRPLPAT